MSAAASSKTKKATKPRSAAPRSKGAKSAPHPPFADIIRECIADAGDRTGVSRPTIKKYIEEKYKMEVTASVISNINRSIAYGAEKGSFLLPKGPSGKVKLAPKKSSSDSAKENKPTLKPVPKKQPTKPTKLVVKSKKPTVAAKKATTVAKKVTIKKKTSTPLAKKTTKSATAAAKKPSAKRAPAKKSLTGTAKAKLSKSKSSPKKTSAAPASKRKAASAVRPTSKVTPLKK